MAEKKESKRATAIELYFNRSQTNGLIYVLDCFMKADKTNKYGKYAASLRKAIEKDASLKDYAANDLDLANIAKYH